MIVLSEKLTNIIYEDARNKYPCECCGILLGERDDSGCRIVKDVYVVNNAAEQDMRKNHFLIRTDAILYAEIMAAKKNYDIVGFYHSHIDCQAVASEMDVSYAIPGISYPIVSVKNGQIEDFLSWEKVWINDNEDFIKEIIEIKN